MGGANIKYHFALLDKFIVFYNVDIAYGKVNNINKLNPEVRESLEVYKWKSLLSKFYF